MSTCMDCGKRFESDMVPTHGCVMPRPAPAEPVGGTPRSLKFSSAQDPESWTPSTDSSISTITCLTNGDAKLAEGIFNRLVERAEKAEREVNELNEILRQAGWGQGEIDSAAEMLFKQKEQHEREVAELEALIVKIADSSILFRYDMELDAACCRIARRVSAAIKEPKND